MSAPLPAPLDGATIEALQAAVADAKADGWQQAELRAWFADRGVQDGEYRSAVAGEPVQAVPRSVFAQVSITGLPSRAVTPDRDAMAATLAHVFANLDASCSGLIEIGHTDPASKSLNRAVLFDGEDLDAIADAAAAFSAKQGQNTYFAAGVRRPDAPRDRRATKTDVIAVTALWADFDDEGAAERARELCADLLIPPTWVVQTASAPYRRAQFWWALEEPIRNIAVAEAINRRLASVLGGDGSVFNADRVMRLGGSVAYAVKAGRVTERVTLLHHWRADRAPYTPEEVVRGLDRALSAPAPTAAKTVNSLGLPTDKTWTDIEERFANLCRPGEWHANALSIVGRMVREGSSDETIAGVAPAFVQPGFSVEETRRELMVMALGARAKGFGPEPRPALVAADGEVIDTETGEVIDAPDAALAQPIFNPWQTYPVPPFPVDCLPPVLRRFVGFQSRNVGADPAAIAMGALASCSGAIDHQFHLKMLVNGDWWASPRLWVVMIGAASSKKTPALNACLKPLRAAERVILAQYRKDLAAYQAAKEAGEKGPAPPAPLRHLASDITSEKLGELLSTQERGLLVEHDELASWLGAMEKYSGKGAAADRGFYLQAYNGGPKSIDRIGRGSIFVENCSISFVGGIQPKRLHELGNLSSDGLLQRFLPVMMGPAQLAEDIASGEASADYDALIGQLLRLKGCAQFLSAEAMDVAKEFQRFIHECERAGVGDSFVSFLGKLPGVHGSLMLILHLATDPDGAPYEKVSGAVAQAAVRILREFAIPHAMALYRDSADGVDWDHLQTVASFVLTAPKDRFTASDFTTNVWPLRGLAVAEVAQKVSPLVAGGWLVEEGTGAPVKAWRVAPGVRELLSARRESEAKRKAEVLQTLETLRQGKAA